MNFTQVHIWMLILSRLCLYMYLDTFDMSSNYQQHLNVKSISVKKQIYKSKLIISYDIVL